jgi:hypothetical protein
LKHPWQGMWRTRRDGSDRLGWATLRRGALNTPSNLSSDDCGTSVQYSHATRGCSPGQECCLLIAPGRCLERSALVSRSESWERVSGRFRSGAMPRREGREKVLTPRCRGCPGNRHHKLYVHRCDLSYVSPQPWKDRGITELVDGREQRLSTGFGSGPLILPSGYPPVVDDYGRPARSLFRYFAQPLNGSSTGSQGLTVVTEPSPMRRM